MAVAGAVGVVVGVGVAFGTLASDADDAPPPTTLDPAELGAALTVPPTLTPVTQPEVTLPPYPGAPVVKDLDDPAAVADSVVTLPSRRAAPPTGFELSAASLAALDAPVPRRSVTEHVVGVDGFEQTVTITSDPDRGRYLIELDVGAAVQRFVVDVPGGVMYVADADGSWVAVPTDGVGADAPDIETFLRNMQLGPIRTDTRDRWALARANGIVDDADGLREWVVVLDAAAAPEWSRYAFGPQAEAPPSDDALVGYTVYVDAGGAIRRLSGSVAYGTTTQRVVHRIEELPVAPDIELPVIVPPTRPAD